MQAACEKRSEEIQSIRVAKLEQTASKHKQRASSMQAACKKRSEEIQSIRVAKLEQTASKQYASSVREAFRRDSEHSSC
ncbi:hypothetical protein M406DRAFT_324686 [Cryphonectria parasitica EP155]|uniref:Uncharacterized protein n=1 Tax=Cryphonectria parasitica (strain ATCC 38755 / EP155) TaxID=660469 RepID=A0A9P5CJW1_CRYP1|nr:uncharacterized protein M406DRAFT_324686 [Cryphonectria parasitica EP155]KAF3760130.1 hypothetical protein M406DRAFT_324686 [Cryphonectria parasitica EP155]